MGTDILNSVQQQTIQRMQADAIVPTTKSVAVDGQPKEVPCPFPSPGDWRDGWIYFLMIDRFNNPAAAPKSTTLAQPVAWNRIYDFRQGGTFKGVQDKLGYIASLGARAIWLSPVLKNPKPDDWQYNYHGYWPQDFLAIDERFGSDGTRATAERELMELIDEAHARGLYVILDIVINHTGRVFDYVIDGQLQANPESPALMNAPLGQEPPIRWIDGSGTPQSAWQDDFPPATALSPDDAVWPSDLQRRDFFRRRGRGDTLGPQGYVVGDFYNGRQLVAEYSAGPDRQKEDWERYGKSPVLSILIRCYQYLIARYDVDGFRIDAVKHVDPKMVEVFGNAIREFALTVGKRNFFTFGEIAGADEATIASFVGRNSPTADSYASFGIDAALDFPLFSALKDTIKGLGDADVTRLYTLYQKRKDAEAALLSSHGEAGRYFVTFIDNHDQNRRFYDPGTPQAQVTQALALLNCLQGIPCVYYGTEQGLQGAIDPHPAQPIPEPERVREALWGKPASFDPAHSFYVHIQKLARLRDQQPALRYGRQYFRPVSTDGKNFGLSYGVGGVIAFSRMLADQEVLVVANTSVQTPFKGFVVVDLDTNRTPRQMTVQYSNLGTAGTGQVQLIKPAVFYEDTRPPVQADTAALYVEIAPCEIQILVRA